MAFLIFIVLLVALWALLRAEKAEQRLRQLGAQLDTVSQRLAVLEGGRAAPPVPVAPAGPVLPESVEPPPPPSSIVPHPVSPAPLPVAPTLEQTLGTRWLVWLGALAVALAGVFLAKYAVDQGLLGPAVRLSVGVLFGVGLTAAGDQLRRRSPQGGQALHIASIPAALTAAGLAIAFACIYAAHALHGLIGAGATIAGLAALSAAAFLLALSHGGSDGRPAGAFIALLGLGGGLAVPALVPAEHPSAWALFGYLAVLNTATLAVAWRLPTAWLGLPVLGGAALWVATTLGHDAEALPIVLFLIALAAAGLGFGRLILRDGTPRTALTDAWLATAMGAVPLLLDWLVLTATDYDAAGIAGLAILSLLAVAAARLAPVTAVMEGLAPIAAGIVTLALAQGYTAQGAALPYGAQLGVAGALGLALAMAGLSALGAQGGNPTAHRPALWAWTAAAPLTALAWAGWTFDRGTLPDGAWVAVATALAGGAATAAAWAGAEARQRPVPTAFVIAALALAGLALATLLRQAWLTAALALLVPALASLETRVKAGPLGDALRRGALVVALAVAIRLTLNPWVLTYPLNGASPLNWLLWGYGLPALACAAGAWLLGRRRDDRPARGLQAIGLVLGLLFACLEIQVMQTGTLTSDPFALLPTSLRTALFLVVALALAGRPSGGGPVARVGARLLVRVAAVQVVALHLGLLNPLWSSEGVGPWPVLNLLLLVYGLPALLFALVAWRQEAAPARRALVILVLVLAFALLSLEVRQAFHGTRLSGGPRTDAEWYSYSAAWLVYALALLGLGVRTRRADLRYASLAVLLVTVLKVFLSDMADLTGLLRILSFLGLGLCLMGIGYVYQRVVFAAARTPATGEPAP
ncbi:DUF2339 domain-containing protein [Nitrospirillum iridis]|uniref:Putative membrane protein n=1 Tax=Nitrospirillum iridis TaxID=765888 RepID=A0A7X0EFC4_9PROT|nr:DUF2339 domain-containing protein [Nitrospirillum iridis]MBB6254833.1 putative membrane protein [Nitrospirillum iridis]